MADGIPGDGSGGRFTGWPSGTNLPMYPCAAW
jgi:hypothetical protein